MVDGTVHGKKIVVTFDTGAAVFVVKRGNVNPGLQLLGENLRLHSITGEVTSVMDEVEVKLQLEYNRLRHSVLNREIEDDFILGTYL